MKIIEKKIKLNLKEKISYFKHPLILAIISIMCFYNGTNEILINSFDDFLNTSNKIGLFLFLLSTIFFISKIKSLELRESKLSVDEKTFIEKLEKLIKQNDWKAHYLTEKYLIIETDRYPGGSEYFISRSYGELIHILLDSKNIYLRSIFDHNKNFLFTISTGENNFNENLIMNLTR
jgi:hypothetical protein